jgi:hypothetical protein
LTAAVQSAALHFLLPVFKADPLQISECQSVSAPFVEGFLLDSAILV